MIKPNWRKALQSYLINNSEIHTQRVWFLKVEQGDGVAIVFNEGDTKLGLGANESYEKGIRIFTILVDVVTKYENVNQWFETRDTLLKLIGKFNWKLTNDREGTIAAVQTLAPVYNKETDEVVLGTIYMLKQNYDYANDTN